MKKLSKEDKAILGLLKENIQNIMKMELKHRSVRSKKNETFNPFFASLSLREVSGPGISASDGAVVMVSLDTKMKYIRSELRVGGYTMGGSVSKVPIALVPENYDPFVFKRKIWIDMNESLYEAVKDMKKKNTNALGVPDEFHSFIYFSKEKQEIYYNPPNFSKFDRDFWSGVLSRVSREFISEKVVASFVDMSCLFEKRYMVNSEGTCIVDGSANFGLMLKIEIRCKDNIVLGNGKSLWYNDLRKFPSEEDLIKMARAMYVEIEEMEKAPVEKADIYPVIVDGENHGVIWHEAIGHSLEGGRQDEKDADDDDDDAWDDGISLTFKGKIGSKIAPDFLTVYDDPTVPGYDGTYEYDEDGVKSQKVLLVEKGVLRNYLHTRETAGKFGIENRKKNFHSNGHSRVDVNSFINDPSARMSNLFVESDKKCSMGELKKMLFKECRKRGLKYGLLLKSTLGGFVDFEGSYFKVYPKNIFRLYLDGSTERVRGLFIVSTPYQLLENIVATSDNTGVFKGQCGAESGWVSTSASAPDAFIRSVEFGVIPRSAYRKRYPFIKKPPVK